MSKIQLALNTPMLYPCQRAIPLSTAWISLLGLGSLKNKDSDLLNKGVAKSDSTRELLNRNTADEGSHDANVALANVELLIYQLIPVKSY